MSALILQNATVLLQNATVLLQMRQLLENEKFATNYDSADYKKYFYFFIFLLSVPDQYTSHYFHGQSQ